MLARVVTGKKRFDHITPVLRDLHWLPIAQRVDFKLANRESGTRVKQAKQSNLLTIGSVDDVRDDCYQCCLG